MLNQNIIVIGGSSGSLIPLIEFFDASVVTNASFVIIRHTPVDYQSKLAEVLQLHTHLHVVQTVHGASLENGKVYYAPPHYHLIVADDCLKFVKRTYGPNHAINIFLESLAVNKNEARSIAVILSGEGDDGIDGTAAHKKSGGLVIVQAPVSCEYSTLPDAVIESGNADFVLLPRDIPIVIEEYVNQSGYNKTNAGPRH